MTWIRVQQSNDGRTWRLVYAGPLTVSTQNYLTLARQAAPPYTVVDTWRDEGYGWVRNPRERNYVASYA